MTSYPVYPVGSLTPESTDLPAVARNLPRDATSARELLARHVWRFARAVGVPVGGQVLAYGEDPRLFLAAATKPSTEGSEPQHQKPDFPEGVQGWRASIPEAGSSGQNMALVPVGSDPDGMFDLAIFDTPYADLRITDRDALAMRVQVTTAWISEILRMTQPGGTVAVVAPHDVLDTRDQDAYVELNGLATLLGAVRLPSRALRDGPDYENPVDLILLRRHGRQNFETGYGNAVPYPVRIPGTRERVSTYYLEHPENVLGEMAVRVDKAGPGQLIVAPTRSWIRDLDAALDRIALDAPTRAPLPDGGTSPRTYAPPSHGAALAQLRAQLDSSGSGPDI
jgi:hypothetical protein